MKVFVSTIRTKLNSGKYFHFTNYIGSGIRGFDLRLSVLWKLGAEGFTLESEFRD